MRENRTSGSEGGGTDWSSLPLSLQNRGNRQQTVTSTNPRGPQRSRNQTENPKFEARNKTLTPCSTEHKVVE